jgi:hypothetical protein
MENRVLFFGSFSGVTRQCSLCDEILVAHAGSKELNSPSALAVWLREFQRHLNEKHTGPQLA